jgi:hypothetical protein
MWKRSDHAHVRCKALFFSLSVTAVPVPKLGLNASYAEFP